MSPHKARPNHELRLARLRQQMSRTGLSEKSGVSRKHLVSIEKGEHRVQIDTAARIANALGKDIEDVFRIEDVIG